VASAASVTFVRCHGARKLLTFCPNSGERDGRLEGSHRAQRGVKAGPASSASFGGDAGAGDDGAIVDVSVVIPAYNEENNIGRQIRAVSEVLDSECRRRGPAGSSSSARVASYEIICVNDCSSDGTSLELAEAGAEVPRLRVLEHRANAGQTAALRTGLSRSRGKVVVTMDGDYQNDPADIPLLLGKLQQGNEQMQQRTNDLVCGYREAREEKVVRVVLSKIMNKVLTRCTGVHIVDTGCGLKAMKQWLAKDLAQTLRSEMHRYIPYLASNAGAAIAQVPVSDLRREHGKSKYTTLGRLPRVLLDLMMVCCSRKDNAFFFFGVAGLLCLPLSVLSLAACFFSCSSSPPPSLVLSILSACTVLLLGCQASAASIILYLIQDIEYPRLIQ